MITKKAQFLLILLVICLGVCVFPDFAFADVKQCDGAICGTDLDLIGIVKIVIETLCYGIGAVAVLVMIIAGLTYMTSAGDTNKVVRAKNMIIYSVVGIVVAASAYAIVGFVINQMKGTGTSQSNSTEKYVDPGQGNGSWDSNNSGTSTENNNGNNTTSNENTKPSATNLTKPIATDEKNITQNEDFEYLFTFPVSSGTEVIAAQNGTLKKCDRQNCFKIVADNGLEFAYSSDSRIIQDILSKYDGKKVSQNTVLGKINFNGALEAIIYDHNSYVTDLKTFKSYFSG